MTELKGRTALLRDARDDEHAITLIVETFPAAAGVRGKLSVRKPDGDLTVRDVPGQNCQEVESAMALIAALTVDPLANGAVLVVTPADVPAEPPRAVAAPATAWSFRVEQRLTARTAIAPGLTWGQGYGVMFTREGAGARPSLGLSAQAADAIASASRGAAELKWVAAELTLCPAGVRPSEEWDVRACVQLQVGRLRGRGFATADPATKDILWSSAGLALQARYRLVGPLWLGGEGAFSTPFSRERFYLEPEQDLHRVPAWGVSFGLGLGLRFL